MGRGGLRFHAVRAVSSASERELGGESVGGCCPKKPLPATRRRAARMGTGCPGSTTARTKGPTRSTRVSATTARCGVACRSGARRRTGRARRPQGGPQRRAQPTPVDAKPGVHRGLRRQQSPRQVGRNLEDRGVVEARPLVLVRREPERRDRRAQCWRLPSPSRRSLPSYRSLAHGLRGNAVLSPGRGDQAECARPAPGRGAPQISGPFEESGARVAVLQAVGVRHRMPGAPRGAVGGEARHVAVDHGDETHAVGAAAEPAGRPVELLPAQRERPADDADAHLRRVGAERDAVGVGRRVVRPRPDVAAPPLPAGIAKRPSSFAHSWAR